MLVFLRRDCPVSGRYAPVISKSASSMPTARTSGLSIPTRATRRRRFESYLQDYGYHLPALRDPDHALVRLGHVQITPEVAVFDRESSPRLRRADRQLVRRSHARASRAHDPRTGRRICAALAGKSVARARSGEWDVTSRIWNEFPRLLWVMVVLAVALGAASALSAVLARLRNRDRQAGTPVTFNRDIAPIMFRSCAHVSSARRSGAILSADVLRRETACAADRGRDRIARHASMAARAAEVEVRRRTSFVGRGNQSHQALG